MFHKKTQVLPMCSCIGERILAYNYLIGLYHCFKMLECGIAFSPCAFNQVVVARKVIIIYTCQHFFHYYNFICLVFIPLKV
jgi:hypothetical protein